MLELVVLYMGFPAAVMAELVDVKDRWLAWLLTAIYVLIVIGIVRPNRGSIGLLPLRPRYYFMIAGSLGTAFLTIFLFFAFGIIKGTYAMQLALVFVVYPTLSVPVQEFFFRSFFFFRYENLLRLFYLVILNALLFSFYHAIFGSWLAVGAAFFGGIILSLLYSRFWNFFVCWIAHYILGLLVYFAGWLERFTTMNSFGTY
jgi:membrane protease YdiL (CAAX protease family)